MIHSDGALQADRTGYGPEHGPDLVGKGNRTFDTISEPAASNHHLAAIGGSTCDRQQRPMTCLPWQIVTPWAEADYDDNDRFSPLPIRSGEQWSARKPKLSFLFRPFLTP
jgi:hypothetical protein